MSFGSANRRAGPFLVIWLAACGGGELNPERSGGYRLPDTAGVEYHGGDAFSVSLDGRWLLFSYTVPYTEETHRDAELRRQYDLKVLEEYIFYDLQNERVQKIEVSPLIQELTLTGGILWQGAGCWSEGRAVLRTSDWQIVADPKDAPPRWDRLSEIDFDYGGNCPDPPSVQAHASGVFGSFEFREREGAIDVLDVETGELLAQHEPPFLPGTSIAASDVVISPDGKRVAYTITPQFGSFVRHARAFVVERGGEGAHELAAPAFVLRWGPDSKTLYAFIGPAGEDSIYRWTIGSAASGAAVTGEPAPRSSVDGR